MTSHWGVREEKIRIKRIEAPQGVNTAAVMSSGGMGGQDINHVGRGVHPGSEGGRGSASTVSELFGGFVGKAKTYITELEDRKGCVNEKEGG